MAIITVNNREIEIGDHERLNCIQAADRAGVAIPFYCWHPGLTVVASCRMCLIETGTKSDKGDVQMIPKLVPACQTPAKHGTVIVTDSEKVKANQRFVEEGLLLDHPIDCPICDQAGECWLQDYYFVYGQPERRADKRPFTSRRRDLGPHVTLFVDRCVMCSRCVRFEREISGQASLMVVERGHRSEIDIFDGREIDNKLSGNVNDLCPVGALCSRDFLYKQRVWWLNSHPSVCTRCATGCAIEVQEDHGHIYRLQPRYNPNANDWWMCDIGRYGFDYVHSPERLATVQARRDGLLMPAMWAEVTREIRERLAAIAAAHGGRAVAGVVSPFLTCEEAYLFGKFVKRLAPDALLGLGPVPVEGGDEVFKNGFTIRAERCPNRFGVEAILQHFQGEAVPFDRVLERARAGELRAIYVTGGYPEAWISDEQASAIRRTDQAAALSAVEVLVVQDIFPSALAQRADYIVPGASFAEKDGSYVNHAGLLQSTEWAIRPRVEAHADGQVFADLLGRSGVYQAKKVLAELASEVPLFARAAEGVPEYGLNLVRGKEVAVRTTMPGTVTHPIPSPRPTGRTAEPLK